MASDELKPYKPEARIMQTLASLAACKPLMELDALLEGRDRVSAQQVSFMLRGVGSAMADYAFTLRQDFDAMRQRAEKAERAAMRGAQLLAEVTSSDGSGHADLAARILSDAGVSRDEAAKLIEGWKSKSQWRIDAALAKQP